MAGLKISELPVLTAITSDDIIPFTDIGTLTTSYITFANFLASFYTTGSWSPVVTFATPGDLAVGYAAAVGTYTKINKQVRASFTIITSSFTHTTASGNFKITGFPFTSASSGHVYPGSMQFSGYTKANYTMVTPVVVNNSTYAEVYGSGSGQGFSNVAAADVPSGGTLTITGQVIYESA